MGKKHKNKSLNRELKTVKNHIKQTVNVNDNHIKKNQSKKKQLKLYTSEIMTSEHSNKIVTDEKVSDSCSASFDNCSANIEVKAKKRDVNKLETKKEKKRKLQSSEFPMSEHTKEIMNDEKGTGSASPKHDSATVEIKPKKSDEDKLKPKKEKKRKLCVTEGLPKEHSKKLALDNENSPEIPIVAEEENTKLNKINYFDEDEATVKDEDIDKFCDEINEEDNQQYKNWIQLVEAKLHPNKKKK